MKKSIMISLMACSALMAGGDITPVEPVVAAPAKTSTDFGIFNDVKFGGELRARYEHADVDGGTKAGNAFTTRFALSARAGLGGINGLSAFGQVMAVNNFGYDKYAPENSNYDLIADPNNARVTQAYLDYKLGDTLLRAGRQMVNLDDQRFLGAVGWRQMPQTFTGYAVVDHSIKNLGLMAAYVTHRHGIIDKLSGGTKTVLLHADYKLMPELKLTGYGYLIGSSSNTYGLMATGKVGMFKYLAEAATQQDATLEYQSSGKPKVDASYFRGDISTKYNGFILGAAYESFGDANGKAHGFTTPLATLHKWQGFADVFLGYSAGSMAYGLNDAYAKIGYASADFGKLIGFYHNFSAKKSPGATSDKAGSELDLVYAYKFSKQLGFLAKAAYFKGESNSIITAAQKDVQKYWVQLDYKF